MFEAHSFAWTAGGDRIAFVEGAYRWTDSNLLGDISSSKIWVLDAEGGEAIQVTDEDYLDVSPAWLPDGRHLLFVSDRDVSRSIYVVEVGREGPLGDAQRLAGGANPHSISLSADGRRIAGDQRPRIRTIGSYGHEGFTTTLRRADEQPLPVRFGINHDRSPVRRPARVRRLKRGEVFRGVRARNYVREREAGEQ